jgi:hypothetical protein
MLAVLFVIGISPGTIVRDEVAIIASLRRTRLAA